MDLEKYYEVFKTNAWFCLNKIFYLNLELRNEVDNVEKKKSHLKEAEEYLLWINSVDLTNERYKGAELIKYNTNRSYAYTIKDYKKERIFIDKLIGYSGKTFTNSLLDLSNKHNLNLISEKNYGEKQVSLYDSFQKPYDDMVFKYFTIEKEYQARLQLYLSRYGGLIYYNKLSYEDQISQFKNRFEDFMILKGNFVRMDEALRNTNLESFAEYNNKT